MVNLLIILVCAILLGIISASLLLYSLSMQNNTHLTHCFSPALNDLMNEVDWTKFHINDSSKNIRTKPLDGLNAWKPCLCPLQQATETEFGYIDAAISRYGVTVDEASLVIAGADYDKLRLDSLDNTFATLHAKMRAEMERRIREASK